MVLDSLSHTPLTLSPLVYSLSGLQYSDAEEYMCRVEYASCPDGVDCREATPVTGIITLNLPGMFVHIHMQWNIIWLSERWDSIMCSERILCMVLSHIPYSAKF